MPFVSDFKDKEDSFNKKEKSDFILFIYSINKLLQ